MNIEKAKAMENEQRKERMANIWEKTKAFLKEFGIILGAFLVLNNFVIASFLVPTGSMENEVLTGDLLFVSKFTYGGTSPRNLQQLDLLNLLTFGRVKLPYVQFPWFRLPALREVKRGDVIVFEYPGHRDQVEREEFMFYLKRCVGLPGDTIRVIDRVLYVNGSVAPLPRNLKLSDPGRIPNKIPEDRIFPKGAPWNQDNYGPVVVAYKGMKIPLNAKTFDQWSVFIMREGHQIRLVGDHVEVDGKPSTEYTAERDYLFGMGDHRDNSEDSRYWGFIPKENLVGTPLIVYWTWNSDIPLTSLFDRLGSIRWGRIGTLIK